METITRDALQELLSDRAEGPHVSIYMPAVVAGQQTQQNRIRFKNLLREAEDQLRVRGMNEHEAESFLQAANRRLDDSRFWQHQRAGLAVFITEDQCREFRLPIEFEELVVVQDRFYVKPLLPALSGDERFCVLALSQNRVRLLDCARHSVREVELKEVPRSLAAALDNDFARHDLSLHGATGVEAGERPNHKGQVASGYESDSKAEIHQFFKRLNPGLKEYLRGRPPLVIAGVDYLVAIYQQETDYEPIAGTLAGNFDEERPEALQAKAWEIVEPYFAQARRDALARYAELSGTGRAANKLEEITMAAIDGRVDTLFVARDAQRWGKFDAATRQVQVHERPELADEELLDLTAATTFLKDGQVFVLPPEQIPGGQPQAAILRY